MKTGLLFGSFNPIHNGHLAIARYMAEQTDLGEVWLVVSPQNPFKHESELLDEEARLRMVKSAIKGISGLKACDVEFHLPKPSFTINTISYLIKKHPQRKFVLILGEDNLAGFHRWKDYKEIISGHQIYVYPRNFSSANEMAISHKNIRKYDVPLLNVSASQIRNSLRQGFDVSGLLPGEVLQEIKGKKYYH